MTRPALSAADWADYRQQLLVSHTKRVEVDILNMDGDTLERLTPQVIDGQVNFDLSAAVTRSAIVTFFDPRRLLGFDSDSPAEGAVYGDRMIRCTVAINGPLLAAPVACEIFTGPLVAFSRDGALVTVEGQGKERFGLGSAWRLQSFKKGTRKTDVIRALATERMGETQLAIPDLGPRLPKPVNIGRRTQVWKVMQQLAKSMDRQLYYDGSGTLRLRKQPQRPTWRVRGDVERANLCSPLSVDADLTDVRNVVWVRGGKPKGAKHPVQYPAVAPRRHPLSPYRLGQGSSELRLVEEVENGNIRSLTEARNRAETLLRDRLRQQVNVSYECLPVYHADPGDLWLVETSTTTLEHRLKTASIPLGIGGPMTVGSWRDVQQRGRRSFR